MFLLLIINAINDNKLFIKYFMELLFNITVYFYSIEDYYNLGLSLFNRFVHLGSRFFFNVNLFYLLRILYLLIYYFILYFFFLLDGVHTLLLLF